jgi:methionine biosynthesis protein MetW
MHATSESRQRDLSYTTPRPDIFEMVPIEARCILDVGCSNGALGRALKRAQPTRTIEGIEFDVAFANEAAEHLDRVVNADLNVLDWHEAFDERFFDCIIFADVLEHVVDPRRCLTEAVTRLKPGGCVVVSLPNIRHYYALLTVLLGGRFPRRERGIFDRTHLRWFTIADAHSLLRDVGLTVTSASFAMRWGDLGGGRMNRLLNRLPKAVRNWTPVREFLTYQMCLRAMRST